MSYRQRLNTALIGAAIGLCLWLPESLWAREYLNSAHGSYTDGVKRTDMAGYATGNCAHCHEMHASVSGSQPPPDSGVPSAYTLFASNFNSSAVPGSYLVADNFCFYCHGGSTLVADVVANKDYSETFGGASAGESSIMATFNQQGSSIPEGSSHNLADIHNFVDDKGFDFPWYTASSNPCNACHNPHLAKRNFGNSSVFDTPLASAISKPSDHFSLWGDSMDSTETMAKYNSYVAPFANEITGNREPDNTSTTSYPYKTPDYPGFCIDCHQYAIGSLEAIDWGGSGDKHGVVFRDAKSGATNDTSLDGRNPYEAVDSSTPNFVLSCLDCHEPHGSENVMLLRRWVNGGAVNVTSLGDSMENLCSKCHSSDWQGIHHMYADAPYTKDKFTCHCGSGGFPEPIPCVNCHFHGSDNTLAPAQQSNIKTF